MVQFIPGPIEAIQHPKTEDHLKRHIPNFQHITVFPRHKIKILISNTSANLNSQIRFLTRQ